jgi:hypothetical protein
MLSNYVEKYINYQITNIPQNSQHIVFLLLDQKFYMFYNENSTINANDLPVRFKYDGIVRSNGNVYYYVAFDDGQKAYVFDKLKKYNITILDNKFNTLNVNQVSWENNCKNIHKQLLDSTKKYPLMNNIEIIQKTYGLFGGRHNISKKNVTFSNISISNDHLDTMFDSIKRSSKPKPDSKTEKQSPKLNIELKPKINLKNIIDLDTNTQLASSLHLNLKHNESIEINNANIADTANDSDEKSIKPNKNSFGVSIDELENTHSSPSNSNCSPNDNKSISIDELENSDKNSINEITKLIKGAKACSDIKFSTPCPKSSPEEHTVIINNAKITNIIKKSLSSDRLSSHSESSKLDSKYIGAKFNRTVSDTLLEEYECI